jgi:Sulfotransferase family
MLALVHIEKCGGTTLIDVLRRNFQLDHFDVIPRKRASMIFAADDLRDLLNFRPTVKSIAGHSVRLSAGLETVAPGIQFVTCLRDPVRRYVSDYCHFIDRLGSRCDFAQWLAREDRHNFQTRSIAGGADLKYAIHLVETRFAAIGVLEQFDDLLVQLAAIAHQSMHVELDMWYEIQNSRRLRRGSPPASELIATFREEIVAVNQLDMELYDYVRNVVLPRQVQTLGNAGAEMPARTRVRGWRRRWRDAEKQLVYRLYRNLVYKPYVGRLPLPHRLSIYETERKAA